MCRPKQISSQICIVIKEIDTFLLSVNLKLYLHISNAKALTDTANTHLLGSLKAHSNVHYPLYTTAFSKKFSLFFIFQTEMSFSAAFQHYQSVG